LSLLLSSGCSSICVQDAPEPRLSGATGTRLPSGLRLVLSHSRRPVQRAPSGCAATIRAARPQSAGATGLMWSKAASGANHVRNTIATDILGRQGSAARRRVPRLLRQAVGESALIAACPRRHQRRCRRRPGPRRIVSRVAGSSSNTSAVTGCTKVCARPIAGPVVAPASSMPVRARQGSRPSP
jgi:hypothetical protein